MRHNLNGIDDYWDIIKGNGGRGGKRIFKKKRYAVLIIVLLLFVMASTRPSSKEYQMYLHNVQELNCEPTESSDCFHTKNDLLASRLTHLIFFMTADSHIFGDEDNKIRVIGMLNHFFVIENHLHPYSDDY